MSSPIDPHPVHRARPEQARAATFAGERLRFWRTLVIALTVVWVLMIAAWVADRAVRQANFAERQRVVTETRAELADVEDLSAVFAKVAQGVEPSVVYVEVRREMNRRYPVELAAPPANSGSGVIMEVADGRGYVLTNNHVVLNATDIRLTLNDGRIVPARIIGTDPATDLAVLEVRAPELIPAAWGNSDTLRKGDWVLAFGSPFGFVGSMTAGIISALDRTRLDGPIRRLAGDQIGNFIQVDAAINPGNSGGPLSNTRGEIVGINTAIFTRTGDFSGIGFSIPSNQARRVYEDIRNNGKVTRGWLGIGVADIDSVPALARRLGFEGTGGVLVERVYAGTPAARSLRPGDIILQMDGQPLRTLEDLRNRTAFAEPGQQVQVVVFRDGEQVELTLEIGAMPDDLLSLELQPMEGGSAQDLRAPLGMRLGDAPVRELMRYDLPRGTGAAMVLEVRPGSPAVAAGIEPGDVIFQVDATRVGGGDAALGALLSAEGADGVDLVVGTRGRVYRVRVGR